MEVQLLSKRDHRETFRGWHSTFIAPHLTDVDGEGHEDVFGRHSWLRTAHATAWIDEALSDGEPTTCLIVGEAEGAVRVSGATVHELRELGRGGDIIIIDAEGHWCAAISAYDEWGPFVLRTPDLAMDAVDADES